MTAAAARSMMRAVMPAAPEEPSPMSLINAVDLAARVAAALASPSITAARPPRSPPDPWPLPWPEPDDLAALYAATDGLELEDGTVILPRAGILSATAWLKQERSLDDWPDDIVVIGERDDIVIALDADRSSARAGGGALESAADGLSSFKRAALTVVGYIEGRLRGGRDRDPAPEVAARAAALAKDERALALALARPFYPGAQLERALAALTLGSMLAARGDASGALAAYAASVEARVGAVRRGAEAAEARAAWRACAIEAERAGARSISIECDAISKG